MVHLVLVFTIGIHVLEHREFRQTNQLRVFVDSQADIVVPGDYRDTTVAQFLDVLRPGRIRPKPFELINRVTRPEGREHL